MVKDAPHWSGWFWDRFFGEWLARVQDDHGGVFDTLDGDGNPDRDANKSLLTQARTLFTLSHVALASGDPAHIQAAGRQVDFLRHFQKAQGLYRCFVNRDGSQTGQDEDDIARSYDQTFVILGLVTWNQIAQSPDIHDLIEDCWTALKTHLTDPVTGVLLNDDSGIESNPAQNPHMHLYEACLQGYRMTQDAIWLSRAADICAVGLRHFLDPRTGTIAEFLSPDLKPLPGQEGQRREVGHQCEWAWLLAQEAGFTNERAPKERANHLYNFVQLAGVVQDGVLSGAVYDAVSAQGDVLENSFLLWPQTEAIKFLATRHAAGHPDAGPQARALMCLMFERWFADRPGFVNQLDQNGTSIWSQGLTRLMYHIVLAMTEGAKVGLWSDIPAHS